MKKRRRLTLEEGKKLIKEELNIDLLGSRSIRLILEGALPFSLHCYCKKNKLNPNILMDRYERIMGKFKEKKQNEKRRKRSNKRKKEDY